MNSGTIYQTVSIVTRSDDTLDQEGISEHGQYRDLIFAVGLLTSGDAGEFVSVGLEFQIEVWLFN